eukprot:5241622-Pyramimonas_sp.AAC.1
MMLAAPRSSVRSDGGLPASLPKARGAPNLERPLDLRCVMETDGHRPAPGRSSSDARQPRRRRRRG